MLRRGDKLMPGSRTEPIWDTLASRYLWQSRWYNLREDRLRTQAGHEFTYTVIEHPGAVWVVPVTDNGLIVLVWHYRHTIQDWCYEVPAGGLSEDSPPEEVARRELLEEIGGRAAELRPVGQFYTSNGISDEIAYVYLATGVKLGESQREPTELMQMRLMPIQQVLEMARRGQIADGPSALALLWCQPLL
jgi:ADP-ribose pyrophosphatase